MGWGLIRDLKVCEVLKIVRKFFHVIQSQILSHQNLFLKDLHWGRNGNTVIRPHGGGTMLLTHCKHPYLLEV